MDGILYIYTFRKILFSKHFPVSSEYFFLLTLHNYLRQCFLQAFSLTVSQRQKLELSFSGFASMSNSAELWKKENLKCLLAEGWSARALPDGNTCMVKGENGVGASTMKWLQEKLNNEEISLSFTVPTATNKKIHSKRQIAAHLKKEKSHYTDLLWSFSVAPKPNILLIVTEYLKISQIDRIAGRD